ncbi:MAG: hypothetical protein ACLQVN_19250 [Bryobacteraceae bacterium]
MDQSTNRAITICFAMIAAASLAAATDAARKPIAATASTLGTVPAGAADVTTNLQPFTHTAYIPAGADLSSIKFESIKAIKVATVRVSFADKRYCEAERFQEPGGSLYCPYVQDESPVPAYRVTYSFSGPPMAADEYGGTQFTFSVNMRPEDLSQAVRQAISERKMSRAAAAKAFALSTSRDFVQRMVIDERNSTLCDGTYTEGAWIRTKPGCEEKVTYKTVAVPSDYIAVKVDPASVR